jgi:phage terminase large subunit-like protein
VSASLIEQLVRTVGPEVVYDSLSPGARAKLKYDWRVWARPEQLAPEGDWRTWLVLAGRGFGKTRTDSE